jgi:hypothetical protein
MNIIEAMEQVKNIISGILVESGFISGDGLTEEQIKAEKKPIFYMMNVPTSVGSQKSKYIVWDFGPIGNIYGDGQAIQFSYKANITFYSNDPAFFIDLKQLVSGFVEKDNDINLQRGYFDTTYQRYVFEFAASHVVYIPGA